ncbi:oxaloacetate decarboxylase beta subunit [Marinilabilia salmonicolor]|jgi:oxaloacetate decarboxylase beta subunit|uniref:Oxaloacetate decarboxylase beta subunit n=2 Tax=Marinilabilia salmonicolor TaxID=989 RepID=A0A368VG44_9BACT|nr:oxaloacetate decarboxylase beta subunit [Marinilabilia salmonicolor]
MVSVLTGGEASAQDVIQGGTDSGSALSRGMSTFWQYTGFSNITIGNIVMLLVGLFFIFLAIQFNYEPLLLVPIGTGIILGNIPFIEGFQIGIYEDGSVLNYLYFGVVKGIYPPLIFLGIGAMTDFSSLISNPRLMLLGAAAQIGVFGTFIGAMALGFEIHQAGAISIIGGADGPTAIFASSKLAPELIGSIAIAAYSYMALVPVIQPPIMKLMITKKERLIKMKPPRAVSKTEKILFPLIGMILTLFISPTALPLLGMLFFGNLMKECGVTDRLAETARTKLIDIVTILLGLTVGASTQASVFLTKESMMIFVLGAASFIVATAGGLLFAKIMNLFLKKENKINPLIGAAGVSAVPDSARVVQHEGLKSDPSNHLLMHAMAPNVSGVIGSAVAAGIMLSFLM